MAATKNTILKNMLSLIFEYEAVKIPRYYLGIFNYFLVATYCALTGRSCAPCWCALPGLR